MLDGRPDMETLRRQLRATGLSDDQVEAMMAGTGGEVAAVPALPADVEQSAQDQAVTIALGMSESRLTIDEMAGRVEPLSEIGVLYRERYPSAMEIAGLERVDLIDKFPILVGHFGYTRGNPSPGQSRIRAYRERSGDYVIYGDISETEALFIQLEPQRIAEWLHRRGYGLPAWTDARSARGAILTACTGCGLGGNDVSGAALDLITLVHSYAHRFIRLSAVHAGIERNALSELVVPLHLGFFVYAAARSDFVLGGLQAVFEGELHTLLREFVHGEHRCALDPGCTRGGGACVACLHLGEPSCRHFNTMLDRATLTGETGYLLIQRIQR
jgi:hypothetical protein